MIETVEVTLSLILALGAIGVLFYTIWLWRKPELVPATHPPERAEEITQPTEYFPVDDFRRTIERLVLREAHVSALADYDRIADVQGADVAALTKELADKWWFGHLTRGLQRLDVSSMPRTSLVRLSQLQGPYSGLPTPLTPSTVGEHV